MRGETVRSPVDCLIAALAISGRASERRSGRPLLVPVMRGGKRLSRGRVKLESAREYATRQVAQLPARLQAIPPAEKPYEVTISPALRRFQERVKARVRD